MTPAKHWDLFRNDGQALGSQIRSPFYTPIARAADAAAHGDATGKAPPARAGFAARAGKVRPVILLWALGVPIPILIVVLVIRSCVG